MSASIELSAWTLGPGYWWVSPETDRALVQRVGGRVLAVGDRWTADGPRVKVAESRYAETHATPREAAAAAWSREAAVRAALDELRRLTPGGAVTVYDGNAYHVEPDRWRLTWDESLARGLRVMGGQSVAAYLSAWSMVPSPWMTAAVAFCVAFPRLWLQVECGPRYHVRRRTDHVEFLAWWGTREMAYVADTDGRALVLVEND